MHNSLSTTGFLEFRVRWTHAGLSSCKGLADEVPEGLPKHHAVDS